MGSGVGTGFSICAAGKLFHSNSLGGNAARAAAAPALNVAVGLVIIDQFAFLASM